jgi:two-component system, chemotaxis family, chemotaxis protein CheY
MTTESILLIEDDLNLRQSIALILQRAGYVISTTDRVYTALGMIQSANYHLLIADNNVPDIKTVLFPKVMDLYPSLSIIILTDQSISWMDKDGKQSSAHYLLKPVAPERLLDSVRQILGKNGDSNQYSLNDHPIISN